MLKVSEAVKTLQETYPLTENDGGHFLFLIAGRDGRVHTCHGIVTDMADLQERIFTPAAAHLQSKVLRSDPYE